MSFKVFGVLSCVLVMATANPPPQAEHVAVNCDFENGIINGIKRANMQTLGPVGEPELDGVYKFLEIYDPHYLSSSRNVMCINTVYVKGQEGHESKVDAKSSIIIEKREEGQIPQYYEVATVQEYAEKDPTDATYWKMYGTMQPKEINGKKESPLTYDGDFNFFHNKDGVVGYSACSVDKNNQNEKGVVLIISKNEHVSADEFSDKNSAAYKSYQEAQSTLRDIAEKLHPQLKASDVVNHEYVTDSVCW